MQFSLSKIIRSRSELENVLAGHPTLVSYCNVNSVGVSRQLYFPFPYVADGWPVARVASSRLSERVEKLSFTNCRDLWLKFCKGRRILIIGYEQYAQEPIKQVLLLHGASSVTVRNGYSSDDEILGFIAAGLDENDAVFLGLGQPRQEQIMVELGHLHGRFWVIACGGFWKQVAGFERGVGGLPERFGLEGLARHWRRPNQLCARVKHIFRVSESLI